MIGVHRNALLCVAAIALTPDGASAQTPDLVLKADITIAYLNATGGRSKVRWYNPMGRHSVVGIRLTLEPGYFILVTERLQRIDNDADHEWLDEAYVEDPGAWRIGRQYLPFGERILFREAALAARFDRPFTVRGFPVVVALCDNGSNKPRGIVGRIGGRVGLSLAYGEYFGASGTSFTPIRKPEDSPGQGRGHGLILGADINKGFGPLNVSLEAAALRRGETPLDFSEDITDLRFSLLSFEGRSRTVAAWSRTWRQKADFYRLENELQVSRNVFLESFVRFERGAFSDLGIGARVRF